MYLKIIHELIKKARDLDYLNLDECKGSKEFLKMYVLIELKCYIIFNILPIDENAQCSRPQAPYTRYPFIYLSGDGRRCACGASWPARAASTLKSISSLSSSICLGSYRVRIIGK